MGQGLFERELITSVQEAVAIVQGGKEPAGSSAAGIDRRVCPDVVAEAVAEARAA